MAMMNNTLANNYLSQAPTTLSACPPVRFMAGNEIIINGNVEFVADGENELVLEINDDPCLQGESKCAPIYPDNDKPEDDNKESKWHCYPNPVKNKLNVSVLLENKHLPGIPTEAEVMENGVDLGEMNKKLLEKVEELSLYVISLQKQIDELKNENKSLKSDKTN